MYDWKHVLDGKTRSQQVKGLDLFQNSKTREKYNMNKGTVKPHSTTFVNKVPECHVCVCVCIKKEKDGRKKESKAILI